MDELHFAYALPPTRIPDSGGTISTALKRKIGTIGVLSHRPGRRLNLYRPLSSPYSITSNVYRYARSRTQVVVHDWRSTRPIRLTRNQVLLGHPHPDPDSLVRRAILDPSRRGPVILMLPLHHADPSINRYLVEILDQADAVIGIMGEHWIDTLGDSFLAPWHEKITPIDMAIDTLDYPRVKRKFNVPGRRGYLYIGANRPEKGTDALAAAIAKRPGFRVAWIGRGASIPGVQRIAEHVRLDDRRMAKLAHDFDFVISFSRSDANPTTLLEAMSWGFPIACTPGSGYTLTPRLFQLDANDPVRNAEVLDQMQETRESELQEIVSTNRTLVESRYTWERFCRQVFAVVDNLA